jgi:crossover junction endodeoxyribonuclease RuvC
VTAAGGRWPPAPTSHLLLTNHAQKLEFIFNQVTRLIEQYLPDELAIEAPFYGVNVQSMLKLGRAQGVAIAAAVARQIPYLE